jgi:hypothetical protein
MKKLITIVMLLGMSGCSIMLSNNRPAKFYNFQRVQTVQGKVPVQIIGTACDVPAEETDISTCRYRIKLPFPVDSYPMMAEQDLEAIPENK